MKSTTTVWGKRYGGDVPYVTKGGTRVWMHRKGQRVRFLTADGRQVGPEQANVAPAVCFAMHHGWHEETTGAWAFSAVAA